MYRRILVPVDGSSTSTSGLRHALVLAKDQKARVRVLNVVDDLAFIPVADGFAAADMTFLLDSLKETGQAALDAAVALAERNGVKVEHAIVESHGRRVSEMIVRDARKWGADVIVMGTHGRRGLNRLFLGSDAERVLREATVPVLLVRSQQLKQLNPNKGTRSTARSGAQHARAKALEVG
ncbi:MAG: universal stress protein [Burkholderiales bacterium]